MGTAWRRPGDHAPASGGASPGAATVAAPTMALVVRAVVTVSVAAVPGLACRPRCGGSIGGGSPSHACSPMTRTCAVAVAGSNSRSGSRARLSRCRKARLRRKGPPDEVSCRSPFFDVDHDDWRFMVIFSQRTAPSSRTVVRRLRRLAWPRDSTAATPEARRPRPARAPDGPIAARTPGLIVRSPPTRPGRLHAPSRLPTRS
jgi:hypothetical protein